MRIIAEYRARTLKLCGIDGATGAAQLRDAFGDCRGEQMASGERIYRFSDGSCISTCGAAWDVSRPCGCWLDSECRHEVES